MVKHKVVSKYKNLNVNKRNSNLRTWDVNFHEVTYLGGSLNRHKLLGSINLSYLKDLSYIWILMVKTIIFFYINYYEFHLKIIF